MSDIDDARAELTAEAHKLTGRLQREAEINELQKQLVAVKAELEMVRQQLSSSEGNGRHLSEKLSQTQADLRGFRRYGRRRGSAMKSKRKKFVPFLERLTPEQLAEFRHGMAALRKRFQRRMKRTGSVIYVRFGDIPASGRSRNHLLNTDEPGVSVYEALARNGHVQVLLPKLNTPGLVSLSGVNERSMYRVEGEIVGTGSDGEPLLNPCKIVELITPNAAGKVGARPGCGTEGILG